MTLFAYFLDQACLQPTACQPPANRQPTARLPPAYHRPTASRPPADRQPNASRPPADRQPTASRPPAYHQPTASLPHANRQLTDCCILLHAATACSSLQQSVAACSSLCVAAGLFSDSDAAEAGSGIVFVFMVFFFLVLPPTSPWLLGCSEPSRSRPGAVWKPSGSCPGGGGKDWRGGCQAQRLGFVCFCVDSDDHLNSQIVSISCTSDRLEQRFLSQFASRY